jgi:hypothetical protein
MAKADFDANAGDGDGAWHLPARRMPMQPAIATVPTVRAIEAAILEAKKPPSRIALGASLASPGVLVGKGIQDVVGSFALKTAATSQLVATYTVDWVKFGLALFCICVGVSAGIAIIMLWVRSPETARLYALAHRHIVEMLTQTNEAPEPEAKQPPRSA